MEKKEEKNNRIQMKNEPNCMYVKLIAIYVCHMFDYYLLFKMKGEREKKTFTSMEISNIHHCVSVHVNCLLE